ncbi:hypothetical protein N657DRAFT_208941 [Parathielavia appendiculata]|uniref:Uncharacterized protein n=1 Tax=Parathielavia appendiculata TaxID=2587402 RepID=A0AAN6Z7F4_9PEZI|nr:hypothetical protein N657DRAFT_208941 [Parathielavia appendiculata]
MLLRLRFSNPLFHSCCFSVIGSTRDLTPIPGLIVDHGTLALSCSCLFDAEVTKDAAKSRQILACYAHTQSACGRALGSLHRHSFTSPCAISCHAVCSCTWLQALILPANLLRVSSGYLIPTPAPCAIALVEWPGFGADGWGGPSTAPVTWRRTNSHPAIVVPRHSQSGVPRECTLLYHTLAAKGGKGTRMQASCLSLAGHQWETPRSD